MESLGHEVSIILNDCIFWQFLMRLGIFAHTPSVDDRPLGMALFLWGGIWWGSLCCHNPFFQFLWCWGSVLFPCLGTFLWHTPLLLLCYILTCLWLLRRRFISNKCLNFPCIELRTCRNILSEEWNSLVILLVPNFYLYIFFFDVVSMLQPFFSGIPSHLDPYCVPGFFEVHYVSVLHNHF